MAEEFETRVPSASIWTVNTLNTDSQANSDLFKDIEDIENLPEITTIEDLLAYVQENIIRFDTTPDNYKKDDYKSLLKMTYRALFHLYHRDVDIDTVLNAVHYIGAAILTTNPITDKTVRGNKHVGIYTANVAGTYTNFGITVTEEEAKENITFLVPVFNGTTYGTNYTKVVYSLPNMATLYGDRLFNAISFNLNDPFPTLLAGQMAWNTEEGTLLVGMNGGDVMQSLGLELFIRYKATETINNGDLLMYDGTDGNSGTVKLKKATVNCDPKLIYAIATEDAANGGLHFATWYGKLRGINTSAFIGGAELYQSTTIAGGLQSTKPAAPYNKAIYAKVINSHHNQGTIFVRISRSISLNDINDVDTSTSTTGQPLVKNSDNVWRGSDAITISEISAKTEDIEINGNVIVSDDIEAITMHTGTLDATGKITGDEVESTKGFKKTSYTDNDILTANGGTIPITTLKAGIYQLYNPSNNTQVVLEINAAGQVLVNGDIIQNGSAYKIDAEEVTTKEQIITLRSDATTGMPIGTLAGFVIKLYDGVNDGMIVIDNTGTLRIGDTGDLQPVLTREETPVNQSPLFWNDTTKRAETLPGTTVKTSLVDNDAVMIKDSADSYKPKWWTFANIKANLKSYFDTLYVVLTGNQTIAGIKTFTSSPIVPDGATGKQAVNKDQVDTYGDALRTELGLPYVEVETGPEVSELIIYRDEALDAKLAAELAETNAKASELKSEQWAENPEDVEVETGKYSALHWASKAEEATTGFTDTELAFAAIFNAQNARITALEEFIQASQYNTMQVDKLSAVTELKFKGADLIRFGTGAPSFAPDFIGQIYIKTDTTTAVYIATGITNSSDFKAV